MLKRGALVILVVVATSLFAAILGPTNRVREPLLLKVIGYTNISGAAHLVLGFPKALKWPDRPPIGHKAWSYTTVELSCLFGDGTATNVSCRQEGVGGRALQTNGPHIDLIYSFRVPAKTEKVRLLKAETVLGSFQDVTLPFNRRSSRTVFSYTVPTETLPISELLVK